MMKKYLLLVFALTISVSAFSKKIKFAVSMKGTPLNITGAGVHVAGTFQTALGAAANWDPVFNPMIKDVVDTNMYSLVVDLPANHLYEYKYLNGDQTYDVEFIPQESRVQYLANDSRWIYLDSTANDTTFIGVMPFAGNHPKGTYLMRLKTCLTSGMLLNPAKMHVAGSYNAWNTSQNTMYSFDGQKYEYIAYVDSTNMNYQYKFLNGNTISDYEIVPTSCATNGNRAIMIMSDLELDSYEFGSCSKCTFSSGVEDVVLNKIAIYPNPVSDELTISVGQQTIKIISIYNLLGKEMATIEPTNHSTKINIENFTNGIYLLKTIADNGNITNSKFTVQH
ncbi:MAG: hypothetical protein RJA07_2579 [Bacteroidota bacterium]|jgi:hypothetical protein